MSVFFGFLGARFSEFSPQGNPSVCHGRQLPLHRGAMGSRCPPGVDRLVFGLIGRRYFGGRGELRSPLHPHRDARRGCCGQAGKGCFLRRGAACEGEPGRPLSPLRRTAPPPQGEPWASRCPPGVDRLVFGLIGRRYFGGRGSFAPLPLSAPVRGEGAVGTSGERAPQGGRQKKRNARVFPAFLLLYSVVRSADRTGFPDARRSGGADGRRRQRAHRSRRRRG